MTLEIRHGSIAIGGVEIDSNGVRIGATGYNNNNLISFHLNDGLTVSFSEVEIQVLKRMIPLFFDESLFDVLEKAIGDRAAFEASVRSPDGT
jgi:hypothetical protein